MTLPRFLAIVCGLVLVVSTGLSFANDTDIRLKYSWPNLDIEERPGWAKQSVEGVGCIDASINFWEDRLGLLASLEMGRFNMHGMNGEHYINRGTPAERRFDFETHDEITKTSFHADMRLYIANFVKNWSEAEMKGLLDSKLALIVGLHWQHYKFDRFIDELTGDESDARLLPWEHETNFADDHGSAYKLKVMAPEVGLSLNWKFVDELALVALCRYFEFGEADYYGEKWQENIKNVYGGDGEIGLSYDFAKLFDMKNQRLAIGLSYEYRFMDSHGADMQTTTSHGAAMSVNYGFAHSW